MLIASLIALVPVLLLILGVSAIFSAGETSMTAGLARPDAPA